MLKTTLDNGPTDEVTGEQGYIDDERSCFWTWDDDEYAWQSRRFKRPGEEEEKEKVKAKSGPEKHSLANNKHKILNGGQKRTLLGGPKERKARKAGQKVMMAFRRVVFALTSQTKAQARTTPRTQAKRKDQKGKEQGRSLSSIRTFSL